MPKTIALASVQLDAMPGPLQERLARAETLIARAAQAGAQFVALPELFNTGYAYRDENFARAETTQGPTLAWMKQTSARLGVHLAGSLLLREGGEIYNALLLYAPNGRVWRYDKSYPWGWERGYFRAGHGPRIAETELGAIGMLLCWDVAHPDLWQAYAGKVDWILNCSCPPNIAEPVYSLPDGAQITGEQMGPVFASLRESAKLVFLDTPRQQTAWLGVPYLSSTACGAVRTPLPNPVASFLGLLPTAPGLIRYLPQAKDLELSAALTESAQILAADGKCLADLRNSQGEAFVLAQVDLAEERPQVRAPQPKPPVSPLMYLVSDTLLPAVSRATYERGKK